MYLRPHCLKNAPGPPQILPQIQDGGQKSNMAAKVHKIIICRSTFVDLWTFANWLLCAMSKTNESVIKSKKIASLTSKSKKIQDGGRPPYWKFQIAISLQWVIRSTSFLVLGWGFRGRWIERRYFRFDQIQYGGWRPFWKFQMAISRQRVIRSSSCLILSWGFVFTRKFSSSAEIIDDGQSWPCRVCLFRHVTTNNTS